MPDVHPVVVVGAGPTGLTAAALLARAGVASVVLERHREPWALPRAVHLDDEVMRVLKQAGVRLPRTRPGLGLRLLDAHGRTLAEFPRSPEPTVHGFPQANMLDQPDLDRALHEHVAGLPLVELRTGCEVVGLTPDEVLLRDGTRVAAAAVLGCDGAGSVVRAELGVPLRSLGRPDRWLVADVRTDRDVRAWDGVHQVCDPSRAATFLRVGADRYRLEVRLHDGEHADGLVLPDLLEPWVGPGSELVRAAEYSYRAAVAERWRDGRVLLLGDAAHQTPPFIGQGLGAGLRDAANLAWKVAAVLQDGADEALLDTYQAEREPHVRAHIRTAQLVGLALTGGHGAAAHVRQAVLAGARRVPRLTAGALDRGSPPLRPGALVARRRPGGLSGHLLALPEDHLGNGWTVVGGPGPLAMAASRLDAQVVPGTGGPTALVRPDRVVLATADRHGTLSRSGAAAVERCLALLRR